MSTPEFPVIHTSGFTLIISIPILVGTISSVQNRTLTTF